MTVEVPDFDPELTGHSAVVISQEGSSVCHALVSRYPQGELIYVHCELADETLSSDS